MNDLVVQNVVVIPVVILHAVFATANSIRGFDFSLFSGPLWWLVYWSEDALTRGAKNPATLDLRCSLCFAWFTKSSLKAQIEMIVDGVNPCAQQPGCEQGEPSFPGSRHRDVGGLRRT